MNFHRIAASIILCVVLSSCSSDASGYFEYCVGPFCLNANSAGELTLTAQAGFSVPTLLGTVRAGVVYDPSLTYDAQSTVTLRINGTDYIYDLHGYDFDIQLPSGYYEGIRVWKEETNVYIQLDGTNLRPLLTLTPAGTGNTSNDLRVTLPGDFGSEIGCRNDWDPECQLMQMSDPDDDGIYTLSTRHIPAGNWELKIALNGTWEENYGDHGAADGLNIPFIVSESGVQVNFSWNSRTKILTIQTDVSSSSDSRSNGNTSNDLQVTLSGDFGSEIGCTNLDSNLGGDWEPACQLTRMSDPDDDGIYTFSTNQIPAGNWEVKITLNGAWEENYGHNGDEGGLDIPFSIAENDAQVIFSWNSRTRILIITPAVGSR